MQKPTPEQKVQDLETAIEYIKRAQEDLRQARIYLNAYKHHENNYDYVHLYIEHDMLNHRIAFLEREIAKVKDSQLTPLDDIRGYLK